MKPILLECKQLSKKYAGEVIFEKLDLVVMEGEIISFVGPSGCGKTTLLRCIAGLESVSAGQIYLLQDDITQQSARKRPIVLMFQQALLFPHLNVLDNVIYGLRNKRIEKGIQRELGLEMLSKIELDGFAERYPYELSGGQQQRVALARALVVKPKVLLLDEPFSSLDPELRVSLRTWMKRLLKAEGITALFVTHDKEEAMVLGDRVAVMKYGKIQQIGEPTEVYRQPQNEIVADFFCDGMLLEDGRFVPIDQIRILPYESENEPSSVNAQESSTAGQVWHTQEKLRQFSTGMVMGKWWQAGQLFIQLETPDYPKGLTIAAPRDFGVGEKVLIMVKENEDA